jgi:hypothetical protein
MVVFFDAPAPGNATKAQSTRRITAEIYNSISPANKPGGSDQGSGELGALTRRCL